MANLLLGTLATASPGFISSRRNYFWDLFTRFVNTPRHTGIFYSSSLSVSSRLSDLRFRSVLSLPVTGLGSPLNARSSAVHAGPVARRAGSRKRVLFVVCTRRPIPLSFPVAFADVDLPRCFATSLGPVVYISASDRACIVQSSKLFCSHVQVSGRRVSFVNDIFLTFLYKSFSNDVRRTIFNVACRFSSIPPLSSRVCACIVRFYICFASSYGRSLHVVSIAS